MTTAITMGSKISTFIARDRSDSTRPGEFLDHCHACRAFPQNFATYERDKTLYKVAACGHLICLNCLKTQGIVNKQIHCPATDGSATCSNGVSEVSARQMGIWDKVFPPSECCSIL